MRPLVLAEIGRASMSCEAGISSGAATVSVVVVAGVTIGVGLGARRIKTAPVSNAPPQASNGRQKANVRLGVAVISGAGIIVDVEGDEDVEALINKLFSNGELILPFPQ